MFKNTWSLLHEIFVAKSGHSTVTRVMQHIYAKFRNYFIPFRVQRCSKFLCFLISCWYEKRPSLAISDICIYVYITVLQNAMKSRILKGLGHAVLGNFVLFCYLWALNVKLAEQESFNSDLQIAVRGRLRVRVFVVSTRFRFGGRKFSKCACSELSYS